jgi:4-hydroxybenzoate decarboxylase
MRDYVEKLIARGEMRIVDREVDPRFELAAVISRSQKESPDPILFRRVRGSQFPVVANLYGSIERLCEIIGAQSSEFNAKWNAILDSVGPSRTSYAKEVPAPANLKSGKLRDLPHIVYRERDAGPYLTSGVFLARDPDTGVPNLSFARCQLLGDDTKMYCCIDPPHDLASYQARAEARNQALDVAILIGAPPPVFLSACASVPITADELQIAYAIQGRNLEMRRCRHLDLLVPADTEIVIEGRLRPNERVSEGPFGEYMGYYCEVNTQGYIVDVLDVSWLEGAYFHALLCGSREDLGALQVAFATRTYRTLVAELPGILDVTCSPMLYSTIVKIDKQYEGHAQHVLLKVFGANPNYNLMCIVVDKDVNIHDLSEVWWAFLTRGRLDERTMVIPDVPGPERRADSIVCGRLGIDATMPLDRKHQFERARTPGEEQIDLASYFGRRHP